MVVPEEVEVRVVDLVRKEEEPRKEAAGEA